MGFQPHFETRLNHIIYYAGSALHLISLYRSTMYFASVTTITTRECQSKPKSNTEQNNRMMPVVWCPGMSWHGIGMHERSTWVVLSIRIFFIFCLFFFLFFRNLSHSKQSLSRVTPQRTKQLSSKSTAGLEFHRKSKWSLKLLPKSFAEQMF